MIYISRITGKQIPEDEYTSEAIVDLFTTPTSTRPFLREYGSEVPNLLGKPQTPALRMRLIAAAHISVKKWIDWIEVKKITFEMAFNGAAKFFISYIRPNRPNEGVQTLTVGI